MKRFLNVSTVHSLTESGALPVLSRDALVRVSAEPQGQIAELAARVAALQAEGERLTLPAQNEELWALAPACPGFVVVKNHKE